MKCRCCNTSLKTVFLDLGSSPASNSYLGTLNDHEIYLPLKTLICEECYLVQTHDTVNREHFFNDDYSYMSSASSSWLLHAKNYVDHIVNYLNLGSSSKVLEVACNDGYLLQNFRELGISCRGVEPSSSVAELANAKGIDVDVEFFGTKYASGREEQYDLIIGNNVFAHVPDPIDFCLGAKKILSENGTMTLEFPLLDNLISEKQFDTIYHEHYSYFSLFSASKIIEKAGLKIYHFEKLETHGGSGRLYIAHQGDCRAVSESVVEKLEQERLAGIRDFKILNTFKEKCLEMKIQLISFLLEAYKNNETVFAYGAAAKGNTYLNYCGVKSDLITAVFDGAGFKQNKYLPGSRIPIISPDEMTKLKIDNLIILPWNLSEEIYKSLPKVVQENSKVWRFVPKKLQINE